LLFQQEKGQQHLIFATRVACPARFEWLELSHKRSPIVKKHYLPICFFLGTVMLSCNNDLETLQIAENSIPEPNETSIVYTAFRNGDIHLRFSNYDYSRSYRLTGFGLSNQADWSPDKKWIVYKKHFQIWKMRYDGTKKQKLAPKTLQAQIPRYSPDGMSIVFVATNTQTHQTTVYTMRNNGTDLKEVTNDSTIGRAGKYSFIWPDWSPDGNSICFAFSRIDTVIQPHIGILNLATSRLIQLPWPPDTLFPEEVRWSPRGDEFLVACGIVGVGIDIWRVQIDGSNQILMTRTHSSRSPEWSADGEYFLYNTYIDDIRTLWKMKRDGTENEQIIIDGDPFAGEPAW